jgi:hypothetical protein
VLRDGRYAPVLLPGLGDRAKALFVVGDSKLRVMTADEWVPVAYAFA